MWLYHLHPALVLLVVFVILFAFSYCGFILGSRSDETPRDNPRFLAEFFPSTILGLLALILGFTFSMTITRFENRRKLVIEEANAIGTAYLRTGLLRSPVRDQIKDSIRTYLDSRIAFYQAPPGSAEASAISTAVKGEQARIWERLTAATQVDRGAIESILATSINSMFDVENERTIALSKTLPPMIYWSILMISGIGLASLNFVRGERRESGQWQPSILIFILSFVVFLIIDIERPTKGTIEISQEALLDLRTHIGK